MQRPWARSAPGEPVEELVWLEYSEREKGVGDGQPRNRETRGEDVGCSSKCGRKPWVISSRECHEDTAVVPGLSE